MTPDRLTLRQATDLVEAFSRFPVVDVTLEVVRTALTVQDRYGISYGDGVRVVNPFAVDGARSR